MQDLVQGATGISSDLIDVLKSEETFPANITFNITFLMFISTRLSFVLSIFLLMQSYDCSSDLA